MLNLTLLERAYLVELIKEDKKEKKPVSSKFYVDPDMLIQHLEGQSFVGVDKETDKQVDLCPECSFFCEQRFIDGQCK